MSNKTLKIFLAPSEIAGTMERLQNAFNGMGIKSDFFCLSEYKFSDSSKPMSRRLKNYWKYRDYAKRDKNNIVIKCLLGLIAEFDILSLYIYSLFNYDAYIYIFGHGLFSAGQILRYIQGAEFFILKVLKKKVLMLLCGSDSRAPYCDGSLCDSYSKESCANESGVNVKRLYKETVKQKKKIKMLEKYTIMVDNPASSHFHTKPYINFGCIGIPIDAKEIVERAKREDGRVILLHAPSVMKSKGTKTIRKVVSEIKEMGLPIEYIEVSGVPHSVVLEKIAQSDIVIDQVYSDTPMAGLAAEAAVNGVPVVVSGYYANYYDAVWSKPVPPSCFCNPSELKERLIWLIHNKAEREKLGQDAKNFVINNWMSEQYAQRYIDIIQGNYPEQWIFRPEDNRYIWGWGIHKAEVIQNIVSLVDKYGMKSLRLSVNSRLYKEYYKLYCEHCNHRR